MNKFLNKVALLTAGLTVGGILLNVNPAKAQTAFDFSYEFGNGTIEGTFDGTLQDDGNTITGVSNLDAMYSGTFGDSSSVELEFDTVETGIVTVSGSPITFIGSGMGGTLNGAPLDGDDETPALNNLFSLTDGGNSFVSNDGLGVVTQGSFDAASWNVEAGEGPQPGVVPEPGTVTALALLGATAVGSRLKKKSS